MEARTDIVDLPVADQTMAGFLAQPAEPGSWPGIVVAHEAFGVTEHIRGAARQLAGQGYVVLVPDLYHRLGRLPTASYQDFDGSRRMMATMRDDQLVQDMGAALDHVRQLPTCRGDRMGLVGFWIGGRVAFLTACYRPDVRAVVSYYGHIVPAQVTERIPVSPLDLVDRLRAAALLFWGAGGDPQTLDDVHRLEERLRAAGKTFESKVYEGAARGFHNPQVPAYRPHAADDAWGRTLGWLGRYLGDTSAA